MEPQNRSPSASVSVTSRRGREPSNNASASYMATSGITHIDTRPMETSPMSCRRKHDQSTTGDGTPSSPSSPRPENLPLCSSTLQPKPRLSTSGLPHDTSLSPGKPNTASRRASTVLPIPPRTPRPPLRRASISTPGAAGVNPASKPLRLLKHIHVGEGALDDSDSSSEHSATEEYNLDRDIMDGERRTPTISTSSMARLTRNAMLPSPSLKLPVPRKGSPDRPGSPDSHLAGDEGSIDEYDSDTSEASHSPASSSSSSSGSRGNTSPPKVSKSRSHDLEQQPNQTHNPKSHRQRGTSMTFYHRSLTKQESQNSMRTVTAPSDTPSARAPSTDRIPSDISDPDGHKNTTMSSEGMPTRRPSPHPHPGAAAPVPALGLSNMDDTNVKSSTQTANIISSDNRLSECQRREIKGAEAHLREIGWKALRDTLDWFAEKVNLCHGE